MRGSILVKVRTLGYR